MVVLTPTINLLVFGKASMKRFGILVLELETFTIAIALNI